MKEVFILFATLLVLAVQAIPSGKYKKNSISGRIIGGQDAPEGFAPYQISLQYADGVAFCSGAILNKNWIVTAGRCINEEDPRKLYVITGTNQLKHPNATYAVEAIYKHCLFNQPAYQNDIGLIRLKSSITFNEKTQPIALPTEPLKDGVDVTLTGWGVSDLNGDVPDNLQIIYLKSLSLEKCAEILAAADGINVGPGHICTYTKFGEGFCFGDFGGPLVSDGKLVGVVNWGIPCGLGYPDMYASTYFYLDWISEVMSGNTTCTA